MEEDLKILKVEYLSNHWSDFPQILNLSLGDQTKIKNAWNEDDLHGRWPQNIKSWISQQPLIGFSSNLKLKLRGTNPYKKYSTQRQAPVKDDLKILKLEYLNNHWSDFLQILNLGLGD